MNEYLDKQVLKEDLDILINQSELFSQLENSRILITGSTGLIGSLLVRTILYANRIKGCGIKVIALARNEEKIRSVYGDLTDRDDFEVVYGDLVDDEIAVSGKLDYIIHAAAVTTSKTMVSAPVETIMTAIEGTDKILKIAVEKKVKKVIYVSSMEVYGAFEGKADEQSMGYVNPLKVRSNYPESKRMCENLCVAYSSEYNLDISIARLAQTFGPGVLPWENRVFAQFARSAINQEDIVLHTLGQSEGNYCYSRDMVSAVLMLINKGESCQAYNICNEETHIKIADMAKMVCERIAENKIKVIFDIPENNSFGYAADTKLALDASKLMDLGWEPTVSLEEAYKRLIEFLSE
ncbi:MAG: NAD-dependent epimerase/dehydratase family protein [Lachnospiraceae bacterium]|nr:NAD-dependent epimerase/dehydratase family protein [Lachnospiraceae bacterium]